MKKIFLFLFLSFLIFNNANAKIIDVPFISQVAPGDWNNTLNCGQTSYYMADSFLSGKSDLNPEDIKKIDDFLNAKFSDPIRSYNGYYTTVPKLKTISEDFGGYENVFTSRKSNDFESIKKEIEDENLVIPLVRISMKLNRDGHFMLMTGFDDSYVYFNDPGKTFGKGKKYLINDFISVWESENFNYLVLKKKERKIEGGGLKVEKEGMRKDENEMVRDEVIVTKNTVSSTENIVKSFQDVVSKIVEFAGSIASNIISLPNGGSNSSVDKDDNTSIVVSSYGYGNSFGYGYGYGYGPSVSDIVENGGSSSSKENIVLPGFSFRSNYQNNKLVIPLEFNFLDATVDEAKYDFDMDYKINKEGDWTNVFNDYKLNSYKYYVKTNGDTYYFRIRVCDVDKKCSEYKEVNQKVYLEPASDKMLLGYDGNDVVMDREEYFNVCFDVAPDQIFLIKKGTKVKLTPGCAITVKGMLFAMGEDDAKISITSTSNSYRNYWSFIKFENSFGSFLENVDIEYGGYYYMKGYTYPEIIVDNSILTINKLNFSKSTGLESPLYVYNNSAFYMYNSMVNDFIGGSGIFVKNSVGSLENNVFNNNLFGASLYDVDNRFSVLNNKFSNNKNYPIYGENIFSNFENNFYKDNGKELIYQSINLSKSGDFNLQKGVYGISGAYISSDSNLILDKGVILKMDPNYGVFNIYGSIKSLGDPINPVVFTSIYDDEYGGDSNHDNGYRKPTTANWGYLNITSNSRGSVFKNSIFRFGGSNNSIFYGTININNSISGIDISDCTFENNYYGLKINSSKNIAINNSKFSNNFYGIYSVNSSSIYLSTIYYENNVINEIK